ncbi:hypothetical protein JTB14_008142 [Gonioctena quinquepunctata]|nr:hypothetical protein JTB14_008142 [Gonioctena quinquepunctata]
MLKLTQKIVSTEPKSLCEGLEAQTITSTDSRLNSGATKVTRFLHINVECLSTKLPILEATLKELNYPDILCVCEHWMNKVKNEVTCIDGYENELPESYRPIALLSCCYKLLERLLHNRICPAVDILIPVEQAGLRSGSSCTDQVLSLTTHIGAGFGRELRTSVAFIDLTAAYDTVWREGLL